LPPKPGCPFDVKYKVELSAAIQGAVSSKAVFISGPKFSGTCHRPCSKRESQISFPPKPPSRLLTKYNTLLSTDKEGIPSKAGVLMVAPKRSGGAHSSGSVEEKYKSQPPPSQPPKLRLPQRMKNK